MKIVNYINSSLSRKVLALMGICLLFFAVGCGLLFYSQHKMHDDYVQKRSNIEKKLQIVNDIYNQFNSDVLIMTDSIAFKFTTNMEEPLKFERELKQNLTELGPLIGTENEMLIYQDIDNFISYYFSTLLPLIMSEYEKSENPSIELRDIKANFQVEEFLEQTKSFISLLKEQLADSSDDLAKKQSIIQSSVIVFFILTLILSLLIVRRIFNNIGKPLSEFTFSANEIAAGRDAVLKVNDNRKDELGTLSIAFQKMINSIREKEQDLMASNEELIAQQDELLAQQIELQTTLSIVTNNEEKLTRWNELIKIISSSLDKKEFLKSIVENMCKITKSDKGIIYTIHDDVFASYGISIFGVDQFRNNLNDGLIQRLTDEKQPFTVKRVQDSTEKGYHESVNYSFDLYLPVVSSSQIEAVMVFSRYGDSYSNNELIEYEIFARQIAIYLEKIMLFEQSEDDRRLNQDILNTVQEGIQLIDADRKVLQVNNQLCGIFEWQDTPEHMIGLSWEHWSGVMAEQIQDYEFIQLLNDLIDSAFLSPDQEHSFIYRKTDNKQVIRVYCKTIKDCNEHIGTLLVHRDITKEYEIANMKSEFVSTVSHELRTPLASILGFTELLLTKELKPERKAKYTQTIYNETIRLTSLINDFLDIQRMESGKQNYEKKYIDVISIVQNVIELQEINTSLHKTTLTVELENATILGDKNKIEQVFTNLLSNAIKYSPEGGNISIRIYGNEDIVSIDVKDEGLGIPEEEIPNLFQKFYRIDNSDRRKIGGTGLGLAIVKEIVEVHGGKISVSSKNGKGSTFSTNFSRITMSTNKVNEDGATPMLNYTIMVIEDDLSLAELVNHELQDNGFHVSYYKNGQEALAQMKSKTPDALVLDIMLADEMDGWTIMKEMKEDEKLKNIPIFISTALDEKERGLSLGAQDYLIKPYRPDQLSKLIMHTLLTNERNGQIMVPH
ncbi:response regulator [Psychrobacillus glaciei]|uniref:histidine kinase n=1 Tax=Psychrobacillus glaciei TaxID=2283160 RepID=A0A5J6SI56_9BACI|nr:ATP-binding protein [Psychrobacillus glaciei]QFF97458.1 response regulator [Psychrobacillus glaciei]